MSYAIDKVIDEIKSRCWNKFDIDWIQWMIEWMKHPMPEEGIAVVEIEAEPIKEDWEAEAPELPTSDESSFEDTSEEKDTQEEKPEEKECDEECQEGKAEWMKAVTNTKETMEDITPAEQDKMDEILKAIKTFFPNENTEDVLVRIVSKLIDR